MYSKSDVKRKDFVDLFERHHKSFANEKGNIMERIADTQDDLFLVEDKSVAVKVTEVPKQTGLAEATNETLAVTLAFTVMVTVLEVAGLPVMQAALEVIRQ